jgi:hypothetical protein
MKDSSRDEAQKILHIMQREINAMNKAVREGKSETDAYDSLGEDLDKAWNVATGGGSIFYDLYPLGRYLELASKNWDHFAPNAVLAYQAGHALALKMVADARVSGAFDERFMGGILLNAYALNAFADHFLTDLFSAGHVRVPRKQIYEQSSIAIPANLCAKGMHDEDSKLGLQVKNANGDKWRMYGDKHYFDQLNFCNRTLVDLATQTSADEVFEVFLSGAVPAEKDYKALKFVGFADQNPDINNIAMFKLAKGEVGRRSDLNDLHTPKWDRYWSAAETYAELTAQPYLGVISVALFMMPAPSAPLIVEYNSTISIPPNWVHFSKFRYWVTFVTKNEFETGLSPPAVNDPKFDGVEPPTAEGYLTVLGISKPVLQLPIGPPGVVARRIYRQFRVYGEANDGLVQIVGRVDDNTTTTFADLTP